MYLFYVSFTYVNILKIVNYNFKKIVRDYDLYIIHSILPIINITVCILIYYVIIIYILLKIVS